MKKHSKRNRSPLAASFVLTLPGAFGCAGAPPPEPATGAEGPSQPPVHSSPEPTNPPPNPTDNIEHRADNTCWKQEDVHCEPGMSCNPPPPTQVDCNTKQPISPEGSPR